MNVACSP